MPFAPKSYKRDAKKAEPRGNAAKRGYDHVWRKRVKFILARDGFQCQECRRRGKVSLATVVDHIIPHRGNRELFDDDDNCQALCKPCHDEKTGRGE